MQHFSFTLNRNDDFVPVGEDNTLDNSNAAAQALREAYRRDGADIEDIERLYCLFLSGGNKVVGWSQVSSGGIDSTIIDNRVILRQALLANAAAIIIGHNHPNGNPHPSARDMRYTESLHKAADIVGVQLHDHVILSADGHFSFSENEMLTAV